MKSKKFKAPKWFQDLYKEADEEEKESLEYLSGVIGYSSEWCKQNIGKCLDKLKPKERDSILKQLSRADMAVRYAWSKFYYEKWNEIKDLEKVKAPEYNSKKKIIEFPRINLSDKILEKTNKLKNEIRKFT